MTIKINLNNYEMVDSSLQTRDRLVIKAVNGSEETYVMINPNETEEVIRRISDEGEWLRIYGRNFYIEGSTRIQHSTQGLKSVIEHLKTNCIGNFF